MRMTVVGAGAIGGMTGAYLARAGHDVTLVDVVDEHIDAIRREGLSVTGRAEFTVRVTALRPRELRDPIGTLILAVKSQDTERALEPITAHLRDDATVLSMQNGLVVLDVAHVVGERRTVAACLSFGGHYAGPGRIVHGTDGTLHVGELDGRLTARVRELVAALTAVEPSAEATDNVLGHLWSKLVMASIFFATALVDADVPDILRQPEWRRLMSRLATETVAIAEANGIRLVPLGDFAPEAFRDGDVARVERALDALSASFENPHQRRTGVWRDLAVRKRKTEAERQVGPVLAAAAARGIAAPLNAVVLDLIREVEQGRRTLSWDNLEIIAMRGRAEA